MSKKFRLDCIFFSEIRSSQNASLIIDSIGPSIILRSILHNFLALAI